MTLKKFLRRAIDNAPLAAIIEFEKYRLQITAISKWSKRSQHEVRPHQNSQCMHMVKRLS